MWAREGRGESWKVREGVWCMIGDAAGWIGGWWLAGFGLV